VRTAAYVTANERLRGQIQAIQQSCYCLLFLSKSKRNALLIELGLSELKYLGKQQ
jgi:hypothetical protein